MEKQTNNRPFNTPDKNEKYQELLDRFKCSYEADSDEFIINEVLKIYADLESNEYDLKIRCLELLKNSRF